MRLSCLYKDIFIGFVWVFRQNNCGELILQKPGQLINGPFGFVNIKDIHQWFHREISFHRLLYLNLAKYGTNDVFFF